MSVRCCYVISRSYVVEKILEKVGGGGGGIEELMGTGTDGEEVVDFLSFVLPVDNAFM